MQITYIHKRLQIANNDYIDVTVNDNSKMNAELNRYNRRTIHILATRLTWTGHIYFLHKNSSEKQMKSKTMWHYLHGRVLPEKINIWCTE